MYPETEIKLNTETMMYDIYYTLDSYSTYVGTEATQVEADNTLQRFLNHMGYTASPRVSIAPQEGTQQTVRQAAWSNLEPFTRQMLVTPEILDRESKLLSLLLSTCNSERVDKRFTIVTTTETITQVAHKVMQATGNVVYITRIPFNPQLPCRIIRWYSSINDMHTYHINFVEG